MYRSCQSTWVSTPTIERATMYNATEQFAELNKANVSSAIKLASLSIENAEKLVNSTSTPRSWRSRKPSKARKPPRRPRMCRNCCRCVRSSPKSACKARPATRVRCTNCRRKRKPDSRRWPKKSWSSYTKGVAAWVEKASKSAPAGSDVAVNALKSTFAASTAAFDQFQKATKQVVDLADASVRAAAANASKVTTNVKAKRAA